MELSRQMKVLSSRWVQGRTGGKKVKVSLKILEGDTAPLAPPGGGAGGLN